MQIKKREFTAQKKNDDQILQWNEFEWEMIIYHLNENEKSLWNVR